MTSPSMATTGKTYHLTRIADIFEQLSAEQIPRCMDEIKQAMVEAKMLGRFVSGQQNEGGFSLAEEFIWTDNASTDLSILIMDSDGANLEYRRSDAD